MSLPLTALPQKWRVPELIEIDGGDLVYEYLATEQPRITPAYEEMLDRFYALTDGSDRDILEYGQDYGVLRLCTHGRPEGWHTDETLCGPKPIDWERNLNRFSEPLAGWRRLALALGSLRTAASMIASGTPIDRATMNALNWLAGGYWDTVDELEAILGRRPKADYHDRRALASTIDGVLGYAVRVGARYGPSASKPDLHLKAKGLADALALQTILTIVTGSQSYICDGCGTVFVPNRQPRYGQRKFCNTCRGAKIPQQFADRARRARRQKGQL